MAHFNSPDGTTMHEMQSLDVLAPLINTLPPEAIFLGFFREDIEAMRVDYMLACLNALSDSMLAMHRYADRAYLAINGYDDDPREIYEIPECKTFFRALAPKWGGWLHFLEKSGSSIPNLIQILTDVKVERRSASVTTVCILDLDQRDEVENRLFRGLGELYEHHAMAESVLKKTSLDAKDAVNRAFAPAQPPSVSV